MQSIQDLQKMADIYQGLLVLGIIPNSPSALAGVQRGDILMEINGVRITNADDYMAVPKDADGSMEIVVIRDHQEVELSLDMSGPAIDPQEALEYVVESQPILPSNPDDDGSLH